mmetsp:Transcript_22643/g.49574  ORF Transcript_22643/g.49574 Transcript_22643/m.49574 type:complete len:526 (+) Transcript_22643:188-1765(+)|eukprot:CAMPEP_0202890860 /NCGR_PEP_ID=MMETSP1392-20130828/1133_1 /ASSEMBLY_ACC=CAM_ASM_000868 /TAXON_ID=225041 /ORGANISM="Chlamydomonas chlamydogama, Strain SAG 11-48b" /LENGTH=525 /DNA_ID=CAMNT_0049574505 /DNA_START=176 /DNA_END=1753 /DNA_ORIENTATION=-
MSTSRNSSPDIQPVRDTNSHGSSSYPSEVHGFFHGWCENSKRFTVQEVIGKGSYGVVCAAVDNLTGEKVAIKKIQNVFDNVADATRILREIKLLRLLKHPDVVEIKHILLPPDPRNFKDIYVVFELMESDLHTVIGANDDLTQNHHKVFLYQLLRGLSFIHQSGVLHRDLKPKNILANSNCKLKICDFGLARPVISDANTPVFWTDYVATRWYRAPELCGCFYGRYSQAVDIWSLGCIFAETLLGKPLFPGRDAVSQLQLITDLLGKPSQRVIERISNQKARQFLHAMPYKPQRPFESKFPMGDALALDLLRLMLSFDPAERPTAAEALAHPYFEGLPNATQQDGVDTGRTQFDFELRKLTEAEVRHLIYMETLNYHPAVLAQYKASCARSIHVSPLVAAGGDDIRRQFLMVEQYGPGAAQCDVYKPHPYVHHSMLNAAHQELLQQQQQQVAAYRPAHMPAPAQPHGLGVVPGVPGYHPMDALRFYPLQPAVPAHHPASAAMAAVQHAAALYGEAGYGPGHILAS